MADAFVKGDQIKEIDCPPNVAYILDGGDLFSPTGYKALKNRVSGGLVNCQKLLHNGKIKLVYFTSEYEPLSSVLPTLDEEAFFTVLARLLALLLDIKDSGFLVFQNLETSFDKILVRPESLAVKLIYLPIDIPSASLGSFERELCSMIARLIKTAPSHAGGRAERVINKLSQSADSLDELLEIIKAECKDLRLSIGDASNQPTLILIALDTPVRFEFAINKPEFFIGRMSTAAAPVDGVIEYNQAITKTHCKIVYQNGAYHIEDLNSRHGTYVNNKRIAAKEMHPIESGDTVSLASSDFTVRIKEQYA